MKANEKHNMPYEHGQPCPAYAHQSLSALAATKLGARSLCSARIKQGRSQKEKRGKGWEPRWRLALPALAMLLLSIPAFATPALQFVANDFVRSSGSASWTSVRNGAVWQSVHLATNGWSLAEKSNGTVWFPSASGVAASPLRFADSATNLVSYVFAVVYCNEAADYSTLLDAPCPVAFDAVSVHDYRPSPPRVLAELLLCNTNSVAINCEEEVVVQFKQKLQLIEAKFAQPCELNRLFLGGSIVTPAWNEAWRGGVAELILLRDAPSDAQRNAVRSYLSARHLLRIPTTSGGAKVSTLSALEIDTFGVFNSVIIAR